MLNPPILVRRHFQDDFMQFTAADGRCVGVFRKKDRESARAYSDPSIGGI